VINSFSHLWPLSEGDKACVWEEGAIVLDTNVFLHVYRFPEAQRERLLQILESEQVLSRLWVPHRVAEEFFRNRLSVIDDQVVAAKKLVATTDDAIKDLLNKIDQIVRKHHPFVNRETWKDALAEAVVPLHTSYEEALKNHGASMEKDSFLDRVKALMEGRIGMPLDSEAMAKAVQDATDRFKREIPPGYEDAKKEPDRAIGDYLIWKQILDEMEQRKQHLVFVVDDEKSDWWLRRQGKLLGPRPELRQEYTSRTGCQIDFATSDRFIAWAESALHLNQELDFKAALDELLQRRFKGRRHADNQFQEAESDDEEEDLVPSAESIAEWFLENYEDPANSVPYESAEGGYQYYAGGPYDAEEVLSEEFPGVPDEVIEQAIDLISGEGGPDWVRREDY
jgi:hypothetical protein